MNQKLACAPAQHSVPRTLTAQLAWADTQVPSQWMSLKPSHATVFDVILDPPKEANSDNAHPQLLSQDGALVFGEAGMLSKWPTDMGCRREWPKERSTLATFKEKGDGSNTDMARQSQASTTQNL